MGAVLGSVIATAGGAWYSWSLEHTHKRLRPKAENVIANIRSDRPKDQTPPISEAPTLPDEPAASQPTRAGGGGKDVYDQPTGEPRRSQRRWWMLGLAALASFVLAMGAIVAFERITDKPLAATVGGKDVGGTTINPVRTPTPTPTESPSDQPSSREPTAESSPDSTPTPTTSSPSPTQTPTRSPTTTNPGGQTPR